MTPQSQHRNSETATKKEGLVKIEHFCGFISLAGRSGFGQDDTIGEQILMRLALATLIVCAE